MDVIAPVEEPGESTAEFAAKVTRLRFDDEVDDLILNGRPSPIKIELVAASLGLPSRIVSEEVEWRLRADDRSMSAPPFTEEELEAAQLSPPWLVEDYLYRDVAVLAAPGGTNKTTLCLWEAVHIALGRPLYGLRTSASKTLFVTGEDARERLGARLREIMVAMELSADEQRACLESISILDLVGARFRLCELDRNGNTETSADVDRLIAAHAGQGFGLVVFDPLASFGAPEETVNSAAQGAINAARRIVRVLNCCVRIIHHTGQQVYRENITDQYAPRGGSALSDGARMVAVLGRPGEKENVPFSDRDQVFVLARAKCNYARPQPKIFIQRTGYAFEYVIEISQTENQRTKATEDQVWQFLHDQLTDGRRYTRKTLDDARDVLGLGRNALRVAVSGLIVSGRVEDCELPKAEQLGARKNYLHPVSISPPTSGEIRRDAPNDADLSRHPDLVSIISPPYRKNRGGEIGRHEISPFLGDLADTTGEIRRDRQNDDAHEEQNPALKDSPESAEDDDFEVLA
ncbi:MAG: AAA family ATPase [Gammaproteobacteria bacterium]